MWENPIFKKVWEVGKKSAVLMKKHYKNGLMLGVLLLAMFFLGRSIGAIAYGLRMQREIKTQETAGTALENTEALFSAENWGLGFGAEGTQPTGTASAEKLKEYNAYYVGAAEEKKIYLTFDCGYENGNSSAILDVLKKHNAPATFFVVGHFLESAPEMVKRIGSGVCHFFLEPGLCGLERGCTAQPRGSFFQADRQDPPRSGGAVT